MKKSLFAIVLAAATLPLTFAAQAPASQAPSSNPPAKTDTTKPAKKSSKKHSTKKTTGDTSATPQK